MKITEDEKVYTTFGELLLGDIFKCDNSYYMKAARDGEWYAVELCVGGIYKFAGFEPVEPVKAELHIK